MRLLKYRFIFYKQGIHLNDFSQSESVICIHFASLMFSKQV